MKDIVLIMVEKMKVKRWQKGRGSWERQPLSPGSDPREHLGVEKGEEPGRAMWPVDAQHIGSQTGAQTGHSWGE